MDGVVLYINKEMRSAFKLLLVLLLGPSAHAYLPATAASLPRGGSYPRKHTRPRHGYVAHQFARLRQHSDTARMCATSDDCPWDKFCCEVIKPGIFQVCCGNPAKAVENSGGGGGTPVPVPLPAEREYDY